MHLHKNPILDIKATFWDFFFWGVSQVNSGVMEAGANCKLNVAFHGNGVLKTSSVMRLQKTSSKLANLFRDVCFHSATLSPSSASLFAPVFEPSCSGTGSETSRSFLPVAAAALILNGSRR